MTMPVAYAPACNFICELLVLLLLRGMRVRACVCRTLMLGVAHATHLLVVVCFSLYAAK